jgi:hypothetical protein
VDNNRVGGYGSHMSTRQRLAGFAAVLAVALGVGWGIGQAAGPFGDEPTGAPGSTTSVADHGGGHP